ncbi:MAG: DUF2259 domain-containing protein [Rhizobiales bacterium]|nr:DUF2259 domain-containing protein [Hyphomicrobiales bacterium]
MRFGVICFSLLFLFVAGARAGDFAFEEPIGFSPDGRYFGFEEYGIQDGSGFPYSNIFVIDLETDTYAPETPVRVRIDSEKASLKSARDQARKQARTVLNRFDLTFPAVVVYARGLGDFSNFKEGLTAPLVASIAIPSPGDPTGPAADQFDLILSHVPAKSVATCPLQSIGFLLEKVDPDGKRRFVHRDDKILLSRGCPLKYRISKVFVPNGGKGHFAAVLISVFQTGFEGLDRRFVVFPVTIR